MEDEDYQYCKAPHLHGNHTWCGRVAPNQCPKCERWWCSKHYGHSEMMQLDKLKRKITVNANNAKCRTCYLDEYAIYKMCIPWC